MIYILCDDVILIQFQDKLICNKQKIAEHVFHVYFHGEVNSLTTGAWE